MDAHIERLYDFVQELYRRVEELERALGLPGE